MNANPPPVAVDFFPQIAITESVNIEGPNDRSIVLTTTSHRFVEPSPGDFRFGPLFTIDDGNADSKITVRMSGVTLPHNISNSENLILDNVTLTNTGESYAYNYLVSTGDLTISNSSIDRTMAIYARGAATTGSSVSLSNVEINAPNVLLRATEAAVLLERIQIDAEDVFLPTGDVNGTTITANGLAVLMTPGALTVRDTDFRTIVNYTTVDGVTFGGFAEFPMTYVRFITDSGTPDLSNPSNSLVLDNAQINGWSVPSIEPGSVQTDEDTAIDIDLRPYAVNASDEPLGTITGVLNPLGGTVELLPDGYTARFHPNADFHGAASFEYSVQTDPVATPLRPFEVFNALGLESTLLPDNSIAISRGVINVNVTPVDDPYRVTLSSIAGKEDQTLEVDLYRFLSDVDSPSTGLTFTLSGVANAQAELQPDGHTVRLTFAADYFGPASFTFDVTDGTTTFENQQVAIDVAAVNDAPAIVVPATSPSLKTTRTLPLGEIAIADVDSNHLTVAIEVTSGALRANNSDAARVVLTGTAAEINTQLDAMLFVPQPGVSGVVGLTVEASDGAAVERSGFSIGVTLNQPPQISAASDVVFVEEGGTAVHSGIFSDPDGDQVTINASVGTVLQDADGTWTWSYVLEAGQQVVPTVTITATDSDNAVSTTDFDVTVANAAPLVDLADVANIDENGVATLTGTIIDPGTLDTFTLSVNWGDPQSPDNTETYTFPASATGSQPFTLTHRYLDGPADYTIDIDVTDSENGTGSASTSVTVNNVAPTVTLAPVVSIDENGVATLTGTIADPGTLDTFTLSVNWGDPQSPDNTETYTFTASGTGSQPFMLTHRYLDGSADYTINVEVTDKDSGADSDSTSVTVNNVAPTVTLAPVVSIDENGVATLTGTIADPGTLDTFTLAVNWGDPQSPDDTETYTFPVSGTGSQPFTLTHRYLDGSADYTIDVGVTDKDSGADSENTSVTVNNVGPTDLQLGLTLTPDNRPGAVVLGGSFADPGTLDVHTVTIDWGDGGPAETVQLPAGTIDFSGIEHRYLDQLPGNAPYTIQVTVADEDLPITAVVQTDLPPWLDHGDAPDSYATVRTSGGARHVTGSGLFLGAGVNGDADGAPTDDAQGDADGDGVTFGPILRQGQDATVKVLASQAGRLDAFLDFNADGDFADAGEQIFSSRSVTAGENNLTFAIPADAVTGDTFARFRLSTAGGLSFDGWAEDGEVEDYRVAVGVEQSYTQIGPGQYQSEANNLTPGGIVTFVYGTQLGDYPLSPYGLSLGIADPVFIAQGAADQNGRALAILNIPPSQTGKTLYLQSFELAPKPQVSPIETMLIPLLRRFDFATSSSPIETGYLRVSSGTTYTPSLGYGWTSGTVTSVNRGAGSTLDRDLNLTTGGSFVVDVPNGAYRVDLRLGDAAPIAHEQMGLSLEGVPVDVVSTNAGQLVDRSYMVTVKDGQLRLDLTDLGGRDRNVAIAAMSVIATTPDTTGPSVTISGAAGSASPLSGTPLLLDVVFSEPVSGFTADDLILNWSGPGQLTKTVTGSGARYVATISGMTGSGFLDVNIAAGSAIDLSGNPNTASNATAIDYRYGKRFDFGTSQSPVAAGYLPVTENTVYSQQQGYGWTAGSVQSVDRRIGDALGRDLNLTADATFVVDVPNGTYNVTVGLGDAGNTAHDQMVVYLEDAIVDTVSTAARNLSARSYQVTVSDGQLSLRLRDMGGADPNVALTAFTISDAGNPLASAEPKPLYVDPNPATNPIVTLDISGDSFISPLDALLTINYINANSLGGSQAGSSVDDVFYPDVNGDGLVAPLDVLMVINYLNQPPLPSAEGEGNPVAAEPAESVNALPAVVSYPPATVAASPVAAKPLSPLRPMERQPEAEASDIPPVIEMDEPYSAQDPLEDVLDEIAADVLEGWGTVGDAMGPSVWDPATL